MSGVVLACLAVGQAAGGEWAQFRGPNGAGHATGNPPLEWSETKNVAWRTPIHGRGWSSPIIHQGKVWLNTARPDGKEMFLVAVDLATGNVALDKKLHAVEKPAFCHALNTYASCTPAAADGIVVAHFGTYGTTGVDAATGEVKWQRTDLHCDHFRGPASSPIIVDGKVVVAFDGYDFQYVVALDLATGKTVWRRDRDLPYPSDGDAKKGYGTAMVHKADGRTIVVSPAATGTIAYDLADGKEVWRVTHGGMNVAAPPVELDGDLFITTGDGGWKFFSIKPGAGDLTSQVRWKANKGVPSRSSPMVAGGVLFMANDNGVATVLDPADGRMVWQQRIDAKGKFFASPILAGGRIYCFDDIGGGYVLKPGREFKLLASNRLGDGCMASPAVAGDSLIVRSRTTLYRIAETK